MNGDTYCYARSIQTFEGPVYHLGYYAVGKVFHIIVGRFAGDPVRTLAWMSVFFGAVSVACMYSFSFYLSKNRTQSLLAALMLLFSGSFWEFAEHGEVYIPQLGFVLLSAISILNGRPLLSSLFLLVAISITPTSCLAVPGMIYLIRTQGATRRHYMWFLVPLAAVMAVVAVAASSTIIRTLNWAIYSPQTLLGKTSVGAVIVHIISRVIHVYGKSFTILSFLSLFGFVHMYIYNRQLWILMFLFLLPFSAYVLNLGLFSGDHLIITFIAVSYLGSYGVVALLDIMSVQGAWKWSLMGAIVVVHLLLSYGLFIYPNQRNSREFERVASHLRTQYAKNGIMFCEYDFGVTFWYNKWSEDDFYLLSGRPDEYLTDECRDITRCIAKLQTEFWVNLTHIPGFLSQPMDVKGMLRSRPVYFVDRCDWPSGLVRILVPEARLRKREKEISKVHRFEAYLGRALGAKTYTKKVFESPLYPVYLVELSTVP